MKLKLPIVLLGAIVYTNSFAQWNANPAINTPVCTSTDNQQNAYIATDTKKGAILVWTDNRNNPTATDIYTQRLNAEGIAMWTANGVALCTDVANQTNAVIIDAGNGSAIIAWEDYRNGSKDIYAQKVDSLGNVLWTANGAGVCTKALDQKKPSILSDTKGGAIIVWEDSTSATNWDIYANRISANGTVMWGTNGALVCAGANKQSNAKSRQDGNGGAMVCWQDFRNGLEYYVYAQRIDSLGVSQWLADGIKVCPTGGGQTNPKMREDFQGGVYVGWQDKRSGGYDVYAQRVSANGTLQWASIGVPVCNYLGNQSAIDMTTDGINGAIISWKDDRNSSVQVYSNRINPAGVTQWGTYGISVAIGINPNSVGDNAGGVIITWQDSVTAGGTWDVYAQRLDSAGTKLWGTTGTPVAIASGGQSSPKQVSTGDGGAIFCWQDKRSALDLDIYAHHLQPDGSAYTTGINEVRLENNFSSCYPNPFSEQAIISLNKLNKKTSWQLNIFDVNGKLVRTETVNNTNQVTVNKRDLSEGVYFYRAINKTEIIGSGKFIIIK